MDLPIFAKHKSKSKAPRKKRKIKFLPKQKANDPIACTKAQPKKAKFGGQMEEMIMMMMIRSSEYPRNMSISDHHITTSTCPTWKLYENPFYYSPPQQQQQQQPQREVLSQKQIHSLQLPISARKIAASFWDLTFIKPLMESELDFAQAQIIELKTELEYERKTRKKMECMNKRLVKELSEERQARKSLETICEEFAKEISLDKAEIAKMKKEMDEERKMLRMAEVLREERVQMKLTDARIVLEEKLLELEATKRMQMQMESSNFKEEAKNQEDNARSFASFSNVEVVVSQEPAICDLEDNSASNSDNNGTTQSMPIQRKASPEAENPHIKRGIKGFVEFPKVVRAIGTKSRNLGTKLECQKAQLRILLKQKFPIRSDNLIVS